MAKKSGVYITWKQAIELCTEERLIRGRRASLWGTWRLRDSVPTDVVLEILLEKMQTTPRPLTANGLPVDSKEKFQDANKEGGVK